MREFTGRELNQNEIEQALREHFKASAAEIKVHVPVTGFENQFEGGGAIYGEPVVTATITD